MEWLTYYPCQTKSNLQNGICIHRCSNRSVTPHVDLFGTLLNHKVPLYTIPVPDQHAWDIDAGRVSLLIPTQSQLSTGCTCLIIPVAPGWAGMPWFWDLNRDSTPITSVNNTSQIVPQPSHLSLHELGLGVDSSKNKASLWKWKRELLPLKGHQQGSSTSQSEPYLRNVAEKMRWMFPLSL